MAEFWETNFRDKQMMWGEEPAVSAIFARDYFLGRNVTDVLIPGIGYGRNARPFLDAGMTVTGIEISQTAIDLAREKMGLAANIVHGSVSGMPFDDRTYGGIFCYALIHLLDEDHREKLIKDCYAQLAPGGYMIFTAISTKSPTYGNGKQISPQRFEQFGGVRIFFYDDASIHREFDQYGLMEVREIAEPSGRSHGTEMQFITAVCRKNS
jgi:SAM-dependent methyltransferase